MKKVLICGNYGATNIGDEAILDGIILLVRLADPDA
jgi:polysaccharide pyruvyl transferase WcaK-like protein